MTDDTCGPGPRPDVRAVDPGRLERLARVSVAYGRVGRRHLVVIAVVSALSAVGTLASPLLLDHPLLLIALSPRIVFLGVAANSVELLPFVLVAVLRLSLTDPAHFLLGRRLGDRFFDDLDTSRLRPRLVRLLRRLRHAPEWLVMTVVFVRPIGRHLTLAGATGSRGPLVSALSVAGTAAYVIAVHSGVDLVIG